MVIAQKGCSGKGCDDEGCECARMSREEAKAGGWHASSSAGFEWGEYAPWPNRESHEFGGWNNASKYSFNFETGMWIDDQGVKFKNGLRAE
jgi:hypothetical protein